MFINTSYSNLWFNRSIYPFTRVSGSHSPSTIASKYCCNLAAIYLAMGYKANSVHQPCSQCVRRIAVVNYTNLDVDALLTYTQMSMRKSCFRKQSCLRFTLQYMSCSQLLISSVTQVPQRCFLVQFHCDFTIIASASKAMCNRSNEISGILRQDRTVKYMSCSQLLILSIIQVP